MSRSFYAGLAVATVLVGATYGPLRAQAARKLNGFKAKAALRGLAMQSQGAGPQASRVQAQSVRGPYYTLALDGDASLVDVDLDGEFSRGDIFIGNGSLVDSSNRVVGTWEGTVIDSSDPTYFVNLTMRFSNIGALTINGAAYSDGLRSDVAAVPIVGRTGRIRYAGNVGLRLTDEGEFIVAIGGVR